MLMIPAFPSASYWAEGVDDLDIFDTVCGNLIQ